MGPIKLNFSLGCVSLILMLTPSKTSSYLQASQCQRAQLKSENQCKFDDDYLVLNRVHLKVGNATSSDVSLATTSLCRNVSLSQEFVCDSNDLKELPSVEEFPKNLTRFFLNSTKVQV